MSCCSDGSSEFVNGQLQQVVEQMIEAARYRQARGGTQNACRIRVSLLTGAATTGSSLRRRRSRLASESRDVA